MRSYSTMDINTEDLYLDEKNPRFIIPPNPTQQSIIDYLLDYEEVEQLALDISKSRGLFAGERIIAIHDGEKYVVLEGNRRVCACKILLNPRLLQNTRPGSVNKFFLTPEVKESIQKVSVDVMESRVSAQSSLAAKHIDGIKKWSTISKYKFFALEFDAGKSLAEIEIMTGVSTAKIKTGLKEYRIIEYVLNLPHWTEKDQKYLNLQEIKTTRLTRLFSAKTQEDNNLRLREVIGLEYDDNFRICSTLSKGVFDDILHIVAQAAFVPDFCPEFEGTRSTYENIPCLIEYFKKHNIIFSKKAKSDEKGTKDTSGDYNGKEGAKEGKEDNSKNKEENRSRSSYPSYPNNSSVRNHLIPDDFQVNCKVVKINDIISELKRLGLNGYVNASAVLFRVLIELSLKYYLMTTGHENRIIENNLDGTFNVVLEILRKNKQMSTAEHSNLMQIRKNDKIFNIFNGYVHYDSVVPNKDNLIFYFNNMRKLLEICLNT